MTNLDKIRKMKRKEFAEFLLNKSVSCEYCIYGKGWICNSDSVKVNCIKGIKKWLKQEVTDND